MATGQVLFHRFYCKKSFTRFHVKVNFSTPAFIFYLFIYVSSSVIAKREILNCDIGAEVEYVLFPL